MPVTSRSVLSQTSAASRLGLVLALVLCVAPASHAADNERRRLSATDLSVEEAQSAELSKLAHDARLESIEKLKALLKEFQGPPDQKAELILRLSDLYFQEGRQLYLGEMKNCNAEIDKVFNAGGAPDSVDCKTFTTGSRQWQDRAIKLYKQILENYPQFARADEATFFLASAYNDTSQKDLAAQEFTRLVKVYPDSAYATDAYVLIGEYYFEEKSEPNKAMLAYKKATADKTHEKYPFAMYKLAWCYYNLGEFGTAISTMKVVVSYADANTRSNIQLQEEALKDLVRFFADGGDMNEAIAYFKQIGKQTMIPELLKKLAGTFVEQGKFDLAIEMYRRLITDSPTAPVAADFQNEVIQAYTKMGKKEETLQEIDRLRTTYGKQSSWARANASNQDAVKGAGEMIEKALRTVATNYHNEAKKLGTGSGAVKVYGLAEQAYRTYIQEFPDGQYAYEMRYSFAELLYKVKKFDEAYDQYMKVVSIDAKGKHAEFCASSAIFAADEVMKKEKKAASGGGPDPGSKGEQVLSEWETKSLAALDQYSRLFPTSDKVRNIIYKSAYLLYNKNHFKEASERFNVVIKMEPMSKEAEQAANLILDSFALVEDWDSLKSNAKLYFDQQGLGSPDFKKEVYGIYENASLQLVENNFKKSGDKAKGAADYTAFYKEFPTSAKADIALNNATVYLNDLGKTTEAIPLRLEIINKFPKSKYYKDQVAAVGFDYESQANFTESANWYEKLYTLDKAHPGSAAAIFSAALFRDALGQWETSIKDYQAYMTSYPDKPGLNQLKLGIAQTYEEQTKLAEASKIYLEFFTKPPVNASLDEVMFARLRYGLLMDKLGQGANVTKHWNDTLTYFGKAITPVGGKPATEYELSREYVGQIKYILAEPEFKKFTSMRINGPTSKVSQKVEDKTTLDQLVGKAKGLVAIEKTYTDVLNTGAGEWGLAALTKLGQVYEDMADTFANSKCPSYLTADQCEIYSAQIGDKAFPQIEKAVATYSEALKKAYELNLYNENTAAATRQLGVLRPLDYPGLYEIVPQNRFTAPAVTTESFETEP